MYHNTSILRRSPICLGATKNFTVLLSSASGVFLTRSMNTLEDCSYYVRRPGLILPVSFRSDLHGGPLHPKPGDLPGAARGAPDSAPRGRAPLPRLATLPPLRAGAARRCPRGRGDRLPARRGPGRPPVRPQGFTEHRVAERRLPGLRGL